ncbi:MAG: helix-turn-helix domain-containing protein [Maribacter sp.]|nr:helix-turn-helix domain-containing protein [Maribacter sp.]
MSCLSEKVTCLKLAKNLKSSREVYEIFGISKSTFYSWKKKYDKLWRTRFN